MSLENIAFASLVLAALPCLLFLANLAVYRRLPASARDGESPGVSVLVPARNEEENIEGSLRSILANRDTDLEVIVLDDHSTDATSEIVSRLSKVDPRVRLEQAPALPNGWCGKQHACYVLAGLARHENLVFLDADVRLAPTGLARMVTALRSSGADLISGVPHQVVQTFSERLLIPLIHFVLLGFLPMYWARRSRHPAFAAGCGQLFVVRRHAYLRCGGHSQIRSSLHDGLQLPRAFRRAGLKTELFDATDAAWCRMYRTDREVWQGLSKNAVEGLGAPGTILPMTLLLLGGQVLPALLLTCLLTTGQGPFSTVATALVLALVPRLIASFRFQQPLAAVLLHPLAVLSLLGIQWFALGKHLTGRPSTWKGRPYASVGVRFPVALPKPDVEHSV